MSITFPNAINTAFRSDNFYGANLATYNKRAEVIEWLQEELPSHIYKEYVDKNAIKVISKPIALPLPKPLPIPVTEPLPKPVTEPLPKPVTNTLPNTIPTTYERQVLWKVLLT